MSLFLSSFPLLVLFLCTLSIICSSSLASALTHLISYSFSHSLHFTWFIYIFFTGFYHMFYFDETQICTSKSQSLQSYTLAFSTIDLASPWVSDSKCLYIIASHHYLSQHFLLLRCFVHLPLSSYLKSHICHFSPSLLCYEL